MEEKYRSFEDLPSELAERLREKLIRGLGKFLASVPDNGSVPFDEYLQAFREAHRRPDYTESQLKELVDAFVLFNDAVKRGVPNQLYEMFVRSLDTELAVRAHRANAIWYAHDGADRARNAVQGFANNVKAEICRREGWTSEQFNREYFL